MTKLSKRKPDGIFICQKCGASFLPYQMADLQSEIAIKCMYVPLSECIMHSDKAKRKVQKIADKIAQAGAE